MIGTTNIPQKKVAAHRVLINQGTLSLINFQYLVHMLKMELEKENTIVALDLTEVETIEKESRTSLLSLYGSFKIRGISLEIKGPRTLMTNLGLKDRFPGC